MSNDHDGLCLTAPQNSEKNSQYITCLSFINCMKEKIEEHLTFKCDGCYMKKWQNGNVKKIRQKLFKRHFSENTE